MNNKNICPSCKRKEMQSQSRNRSTGATLMKCPGCKFCCKMKFLGAISLNYIRIADDLLEEAKEKTGMKSNQLRLIVLLSYFMALELFVSAWLRDNLNRRKIEISKDCYMKLHWKITDRLTKGFKDVTGKKIDSPFDFSELEVVRDRRNSIVHGGKFSLATIGQDVNKARKVFFDVVQCLSNVKEPHKNKL